MSIGQNVKRLREEKGLTQVQLAEEVGIGRSYLCRIERDSATLNLNLATVIADKLDCSVEDLAAQNH